MLSRRGLLSKPYFACSDAAAAALAQSHPNQPEVLAFWSNLREGFDLFEKDHRALKITVASDGKYKFGEESRIAEAR